MSAAAMVTKLLEDEDVDPQRYLDALPDRRRIVLEVTLVFDQPIEDMTIVMHNVWTGLQHAQRTMGLAPDDEPVQTTRIQVRAIRPPNRYVINDAV